MKTEIIVKENRFDFDSGYITKSPCRNCNLKHDLPACADDCELLSQLQDLLAGTVSFSNKFSEYETYSLMQKNSWDDL